MVTVTVPRYTLRETDRGYVEVTFDQPLPIDDDAIDQTNLEVNRSLRAEMVTNDIDAYDWRDDQTLWVWEA